MIVCLNRLFAPLFSSFPFRLCTFRCAMQQWQWVHVLCANHYLQQKRKKRKTKRERDAVGEEKKTTIAQRYYECAMRMHAVCPIVLSARRIKRPEKMGCCEHRQLIEWRLYNDLLFCNISITLRIRSDNFLFYFQ